MGRLLSICVPTYNRKDVLINEIRDYLSVDDNRFEVRVSDNCSTDGTQESLKEFNDTRLVLSFNKENIGSVPNIIQVLSQSDSDYIILCLDKDLINIKLLTPFLDYLESEKPFFGFSDLDISKSYGIVGIQPGYNNVLKMAYLNRHPSGYFYKKDLFVQAIKKESFHIIDKFFDFPFEVINAELALEYPSAILSGGLVINANYREELKGNKTRTFNEYNIWFGAPRRKIEYGYYIDSALDLSITSCEKFKLAKMLTENACYNVSLGLRKIMRTEGACSHYNVRLRDVGFREMYINVKEILQIFREKSIDRLNKGYIHVIRNNCIAQFIVRYFYNLFKS